MVPDCPRTAKPTFLSNFDWNLLTAATPIEELIKKPAAETIFGNTTEREHTKPPPEKLKAESTEKLNNDIKDLNENKVDEDKEENNNNHKNNKPPVRKLNIKKHVKEIRQNTERERSPSPQKATGSPQKIANTDETFNNHSSPHKEIASLSPHKINGHKSFEVLEITENPKPTKRSISRQGTHEIDEHPSRRAPSRQEIQQNDEYNSRRAPSRQETHENGTRRAPSRQDESPRKLRNGSSHRYLESPAAGSEGVIEGIVDGVNEVETLNEQGQDVSDDGDGNREKDEEIRAMVEGGNMEQLAAVVLNGEGDRLVGQHSENAELQTFLDNVPVYMVF